MKNLRVSCQKIVMHLFFLVLIFYSCTDEDSELLTLNTPENTAPIAITTADILSGDAPLQVNFTGNYSSDDNGIVSYYWEFPGDSSSAPNTTHTFNNPGVHDITLTVTDDANLTATATLTITVTQGSVDNTEGACITNGGKANESGLKTWCWADMTLPTGITDSFDNGTLALNVECDMNDVSIVGDRLHFNIDPLTPVATCGEEIYNKRAEIRTMPWPVQNPLGTEEWIGFNYKFEDDYVIDSTNPFLFYQHHQGVTGSPPWDLSIFREGQRLGNPAGEIFVVNNANDNAPTYYDRTATGVIPQPGQSINVVIHVIHNLGASGLLQIWIDGVSVYDKNVSNVWPDKAWGGNAKIGLYMYSWTDEAGVTASANAGVTSIHTSVGGLRIITRRLGDEDYLSNSYSLVDPN